LGREGKLNLSNEGGTAGRAANSAKNHAVTESWKGGERNQPHRQKWGGGGNYKKRVLLSGKHKEKNCFLPSRSWLSESYNLRKKWTLYYLEDSLRTTGVHGQILRPVWSTWGGGTTRKSIDVKKGRCGKRGGEEHLNLRVKIQRRKTSGAGPSHRCSRKDEGTLGGAPLRAYKTHKPAYKGGPRRDMPLRL